MVRINDVDGEEILSNKDIVFLFALGRSGSNLLHSLLDSHQELLILPINFWFYFDWEFHLSKCVDNPSQLIKSLLTKTSFKNDWYLTNLGTNKDECFEFKREEIAKELEYLLSSRTQIQRKEFLLLIHVAYAKIHGLDLSKIKTIVLHHHFPINEFSYNFFNGSLKDKFQYIDFFKEVEQDFPGIKVIQTIRHPYQTVLSTLKAASTRSLDYFYINFIALVIHYDSALFLKDKLNNNYSIVRYEDLHQDTITTMQKVSEFLNITFNPVLLQSTFGGKLWWGNNPMNPINGTSKAMADINYSTELETQYLELSDKYLKNYVDEFQYELNHSKTKHDLMTEELSKKSFSSYLHNLDNYLRNKKCHF